ncbi:uncharacterized protein LOC143238690 [Tachypleus tridentatus]|uniref:uncharacterized protein LOC143238690 n=1 Tax=Tachypleus tridentatus TaxID=6853 RepID=UPI003FD481E2
MKGVLMCGFLFLFQEFRIAMVTQSSVDDQTYRFNIAVTETPYVTKTEVTTVMWADEKVQYLTTRVSDNINVSAITTKPWTEEETDTVAMVIPETNESALQEGDVSLNITDPYDEKKYNKVTSSMSPVKPRKEDSLFSQGRQFALPECVPQQVCNTLFLALNHVQQMCSCPLSFTDPCSKSIDPRDGHTIKLVHYDNRKVRTQIKMCEHVETIKVCQEEKEWTLLAMQSLRTGKAQYLVICQCPQTGNLEGPIQHKDPPLASIPGLRIYGMLCSRHGRRGRHLGNTLPEFPWRSVHEALKHYKRL